MLVMQVNSHVKSTQLYFLRSVSFPECKFYFILKIHALFVPSKSKLPCPCCLFPSFSPRLSLTLSLPLAVIC